MITMRFGKAKLDIKPSPSGSVITSYRRYKDGKFAPAERKLLSYNAINSKKAEMQFQLLGTDHL